MKPEISIVVTVYNIEKYLPRFFESFEKQTYKNYQILMFDDGSTDNSLSVCENYAKKDERIKVYHLEHVGISAARNYSMEFLDTEYTVHADGDDYVEPDYLKHLIDAIKKYDADWAISNIVYRSEEKNINMSSFPKIGEKHVTKESFKTELPTLFDDRRFNYLYGKIYKSEIFKTLRVEPDVKQGSDTMINSQYIGKIKDFVLIDDADYNYIKYGARSVTSYSGDDAFFRILRINEFLYEKMKEYEYLSEEMKFVIYQRILRSATWVIDRILNSKLKRSEKACQIDKIITNKRYVEAYNYIIEKGYHDTDFDFDVIVPQSGKSYLKWLKNNKIKSFILKLIPGFIKRVREKRRGGVSHLF